MMNVTASTWNGWDILSVEGKFVVKYLTKVREELETFAMKANPRVAFDMSQATYIDSSAITLVLNYHKRLLSLNGNVVVFGASDDARSIFSIVGLDKSVTVYNTRKQFEQAM